MENKSNYDCVYHNRLYHSGSVIHGYMGCLTCRDGKWHDVDEGLDKSKVSLAYVYH